MLCIHSGASFMGNVLCLTRHRSIVLIHHATNVHRGDGQSVSQSPRYYLYIFIRRFAVLPDRRPQYRRSDESITPPSTITRKLTANPSQRRQSSDAPQLSMNPSCAVLLAMSSARVPVYQEQGPRRLDVALVRQEVVLYGRYAANVRTYYY